MHGWMNEWVDVKAILRISTAIKKTLEIEEVRRQILFYQLLLFQNRNLVSAVEARPVVRKSTSYPFLTRLRSGFNLIGLVNGSLDQHLERVSPILKCP